MTIPAWPAALNRYVERNSWTFDPGDPTARTDMDSGPGRVRNRFSRSVPTVSGRLIMRAWEFEVFKSFWAIDLSNGASWFTMPVWEGEAYVEREVRLQGKFQSKDAGHMITAVTLQLEIRALVTLDGAAAYIIGAWGPDVAAAFIDDLHTAVHVELPAATGGL